MTIKKVVKFDTSDQNKIYDVAKMLQELVEELPNPSSLELADRYLDFDDLRDIVNILYELSRDENTTISFD